MLNTPSSTAMVASIAQHARHNKAIMVTIRLQLRQHRERPLCGGGALVSLYKLRQQVDGCNSQLDLLDLEVKMSRRELVRYPISNEKKTAYIIVQ